MVSSGFLYHDCEVLYGQEACRVGEIADESPVHLEPLYDSHKVAAQYRISEKSLHRWARMGMIPAVKCGRLWRFRKSAIDQWMNSRIAN
ncbi:MAG: helix-turn-helix domain-containing protein [Acidobacteriaceae bacterium]